MNTLTVTSKIHFGRGQRSQREMRPGDAPAKPKGRVPRVSKLMALAIRFDGLIRDDVVADFAELSRLGHVTRARMTQIMNLLHLAPEIQEAILFLPRVEAGKDPVTERELRALVAEMEWGRQRRMWRERE
ncbi:MAG: hypothetical protein WEB58_06335 [Planctomycetaceae bacterium]